MSEDRKLVSIETIADLQPIKGADRIELATIKGWKCVVKKGEFQVGDPAVFFEIDSFLPSEHYPEEDWGYLGNLRPHDDGSRGYVIKTRKFKKQISQGFATPLMTWFKEPVEEDGHFIIAGQPGADVTDMVNVKLYEPPVDAQLRGLVKGTRPSWITKSDEERAQNMPYVFTNWAGYEMVATQKLDGSSMTVYRDELRDEVGVCSRNQNLTEVEGNSFWDVARRDGLFDLLPAGSRVYMQGELHGRGIQGNPLNLPGLQFNVFNLVVDDELVPRADWPVELLEISVPTYDIDFPKSLEEAITVVDNLKSKIGDGPVEGVVFRAKNATRDEEGNRISVKVISPKYLLGHDL